MIRNYLLAACLVVVWTGCSKTDTQSANANSHAANLKSVGSSANNFLSASAFNAVNIELDYMPGYPPDGTAITNLTNYLGQLINKPGGIQVNLSQIPASGKTTLALTDVTALESQNRNIYNSGQTLAVHIMYVDADYSTANTLGIAYRNTSIVIFEKTILANSGGIGQPSRTKLESISLEHEFGHLLGLVDLGSPMLVPHKDASTNHCTNSACLMYSTTNIGGMGGVLANTIPVLDDNCRNDLRANGGK